MSSMTDIRPSPIAGQWYPGNARLLGEQINHYMDAAQLPELKDEIVAVMAPHAGYLYSGPVAGYAFAALREVSAHLVIVVSPMHHPYYEPVLTTAHDAYATPLGVIPVDQQAIQTLDGFLRAEVGFGLTPVTRDPEHSLEIELPFLQQALSGSFALLPVMMRDQSQHVARGLGKALARLINEMDILTGARVLLVASTDLSHFYPQRVAEVLDTELLRQVSAFDPDGVIRVEEEGKGFACGRGALAAVLWAAKELGADQARVLHHATSGDITGDYSRVVGYGAAVFTRKAK